MLDEQAPKVVAVPRASWWSRLIALLMLILSAALLLYAYWGWTVLTGRDPLNLASKLLG